MKRYEVSDAPFALVADVLPANGRRGGQWRDHRTLLSAVPWELHTGAQWREPPGRSGPWTTAHARPLQQAADGTVGRLLERLRRRLDERGLIGHEVRCVDATQVRAWSAGSPGGKTAPGEPADHARGRSRGGYGSKLHLVTDGAGLPLAVRVTAGQAHESAHVERLPERGRAKRPGRGRPRSRPAAAGDNGYTHPRTRRYPAGRGIRAVIPRRSDQRPGDGRVRFDRALHRRRNVVERCVGWLRENRRLATRHEKLAVNFEAMAVPAVVRLCLRKLDSPDRS